MGIAAPRHAGCDLPILNKRGAAVFFATADRQFLTDNPPAHRPRRRERRAVLSNIGGGLIAMGVINGIGALVGYVAI